MSTLRETWGVSVDLMRAAKLFVGFANVRCLVSYCSRERVAVDVGANVGLYSLLLASRSAEVHAFEANPVLARRLEARVSRFRRIHVHSYGLSDRAGEAILSVPIVDGIGLHGHGTLARVAGSACETHRVRLRRLDDEDLSNVGVIKIDVEGHELEVLSGGRETIKRERPMLLVELLESQRDGIIRAATAWLGDLGYDGYFSVGGRLESITRYDPASQVYGSPTFTSDFVFLPSERTAPVSRTSRGDAAGSGPA